MADNPACDNQLAVLATCRCWHTTDSLPFVFLGVTFEPMPLATTSPPAAFVLVNNLDVLNVVDTDTLPQEMALIVHLLWGI